MSRVFGSFAEEKEFYRKNDSSLGGCWEHQPVDNDIKPFIDEINRLPFAFSKGMCCSGSFSDHHTIVHEPVEQYWVKEYFKGALPKKGTVPIATYNFSSGGHNERFGLGVKDAQGYAVIRALITNSKWPDLENILHEAPLSLLLPLEKGVRYDDIRDKDKTPGTETFTYQLFVPSHLACKHPENTTYLTLVWKKLADEIAKISRSKGRLVTRKF